MSYGPKVGVESAKRIAAREIKAARGDAAEDGGMLSDEELERWRKLFDPKRTSVKNFLQSFTIKTDAASVHGQDVVSEVQFMLRPVQLELLARTERAWRRGKAARFRIPKSRGQGVSSFWMAFLGFERILRVPGYEFTAVAQGQDEVEEHLDRLTEFYGQIPKKVLRALGIVRLRGTRKQFIFRHGGYRKSRVTVKSARKQGLGRGGQNNAILTTERPHWPSKSKRDLSGLTGRCQNIPGNVIADESTALGLDEFHDDCIAARDGKGGGFELFFIASYEKWPQNYAPLEVDEKTFEESIGKEQRHGGGEEHTVLQRVAKWWRKVMDRSADYARTRALEFLNWRRGKIEADFKHVNVFHREEPTYLEEAFQGYGRLVFPADLMELNLDAARIRRGNAMRGSLIVVAGERRFDLSSDGPLVIFERPVMGELYAFGADVASGALVHASSGDEADFSALEMLHARSGRTVAVFKQHIYPHPFATFILRLAAWYNGALGLVESNNDGGTVISHLLDDEVEIGGLTGGDIMLTTERMVKIDTGAENVRQYGWKTTTRTKPFLASAVTAYLMEWGDPSSRAGESPLNLETLHEMLRFVYNARGGMEAETGHDDLVIAHALALSARKMVLEDAPTSSPINRGIPENLKALHAAIQPQRLGESWKPSRGPDGKYKTILVKSAAGIAPGDPGCQGY